MSQGRAVRVAKRLAAAVTFMIAVWGAFTGTSAWKDSRTVRVDLSVSGRAIFAGDSLDFSNVWIGVVNRSSRSVVIDEAELEVDRTRLMQMHTLPAATMSLSSAAS